MWANFSVNVSCSFKRPSRLFALLAEDILNYLLLLPLLLLWGMRFGLIIMNFRLFFDLVLFTLILFWTPIEKHVVLSFIVCSVYFILWRIQICRDPIVYLQSALRNRHVFADQHFISHKPLILLKLNKAFTIYEHHSHKLMIKIIKLYYGH